MTRTNQPTNQPGIYISGNEGDGIRCNAPGLRIAASTFIGLAPPAGSGANDKAAASTLALGNHGHGIRLESTAVRARVGAPPYDECSPDGYMICTTSACCEFARKNLKIEGVQDGTVSFITDRDLECPAAVRLLQVAVPPISLGKGNYGDLLPHGCSANVDFSDWRVNTAGDNSDPCGSGWRAEQKTCDAAKPTISPILKCIPTTAVGSADADNVGLSPIRISSNGGAGISCAAPQLAVANTIVGLGPSGEHVEGVFGNNYGTDGDVDAGQGSGGGIVLEKAAVRSSIGLEIDMSHKSASVYISGNAGSGIQSAAPHLYVANTAIGLDATIPPPTVQCTSDFDATDALANGPRKTICSGSTGNGCMDYQGQFDSLTWTTDACQEAGSYIASFRYVLAYGNRPQRVTVNGVDIVASQSFPATGGWSTWGTVDVAVTLAAGTNTIKLTGTGYSGGNYDKMSIIVDENAALSHDAAPNTGVAGIELLGTATNCIIGSRFKSTKPRTWIAGNTGHGIVATGTSVMITTVDVGFNLQGEPIPNNGYGVLVEGAGASPMFAAGTNVGASGNCGVRVGYDCIQPVEDSNKRIYKNTAASYDDESVLSSFLNGQGTDACSRCICENITTPEAVRIDCSANAVGQEPNFGSDFFSSLPQNTSVLLMPSAKVTWIDWDLLFAAAGPTLEVLDLSGNDLLQNPFPPPDRKDISFPMLTTLNLHGTILGALAPTSIQAMCGSAAGNSKTTTGFPLQSLDVSASVEDTLPRETINLDLTGFTNLAAFSWHNKDTCPPGFYPTTDSPSTPFDVLCGKCRSGTEKLEAGGTLADCKPCDAEKFDFDDDASTPCEASKFTVESFKHYIPADKDEVGFAFSPSADDLLNNDPLRTPPDHPDPEALYFGTRQVAADAHRTITSYQTVYAGVSILLPPIELVSIKDASAAQDKIEFTVEGVPAEFFINPSTGAIFAKPALRNNKSNASFAATMYAVDGDGSRAELETIRFTVVHPDTSNPANGPGGEDCANGAQVDGTRFDGDFTCNCIGTAFENVENTICNEQKPCEVDESLDVVNGECKLFTANITTDDDGNKVRARTGTSFTDPTKVAFYAVGETFQLSPWDVTDIQPSAGPEDALQYFADPIGSSNVATLPAGLFMKSDTGDILVNFRPEDADKTYRLTTRVEDAGKATIILETIEMKVRYRDVDPNHPNNAIIGPNNKGCLNGGLVAEDETVNDPFDGAYVCDCAAIPFTGDNCESATVCESWQSFQNGECVDFELHVDTTTREKASSAKSVVYTDPDMMMFYTVNQTVRIAPLNITSATQYSLGTRTDVAFTMTTDADRFFLNPTTGEVQGSFAPFDPPTETRSFTIKLSARDKGGAERPVEEIAMQVRYKDIDVPSYGPDGKDCLNGERFDGTQFDGAFTCDCKDEYRGDLRLCETSIAAAALADEKEQNIIIAAASGSIFGLILLGVAAKLYYNYWLSIQPIDWGKEIARMVASGNITAADDHSHKSWTPREIARRHVNLIEKVGSGQFGDVFKAMLDEQSSRGTPEYVVAAKTVKDAANNPEGARELVAEATVMMQVVGHANLVSIIGVVTTGDPLILILQYCEHGSVLGYLKKTFAAGEEVSVEDKMVMAAEVAAGMAHLAQKLLIHRDLAARNVLLAAGKSASGKTCKVADFGLSRGANNDESSTSEDYYKSSSGVFPVRWTSPEAMETLKFSPASDVWSFGIVVVELFQNGETPYRGKPNPDVMTLTMSGGRHEQPTDCDDAVYSVLLQCWDADAASRPSFEALQESFTTFSAPKVQPRIDNIWGKRTKPAKFVSARNVYNGFGFDDDDEPAGNTAFPAAVPRWTQEAAPDEYLELVSPTLTNADGMRLKTLPATTVPPLSSTLEDLQTYLTVVSDGGTKGVEETAFGFGDE